MYRTKRALEAMESPPADSIRAAYKPSAASSYVELVLVIDKALYRSINNDERVHRYCLDLVNVMNAIYRLLNIYIALVGVVIWSERDQIEISTDSSKTLENFLSYRRSTMLKKIRHDNAHLLTGVQFTDGNVGLTMVGSMCTVNRGVFDRWVIKVTPAIKDTPVYGTYAKSGGVEAVDMKLVAPQASTIAHEMGHNFNIHHNGPDCHHKQSSSGNCIIR